MSSICKEKFGRVQNEYGFKINCHCIDIGAVQYFVCSARDMNEPNKSEPNNMSSGSYGSMSGSTSMGTSDPNTGGCVPRRDVNEPNKS